jgi:hypothetical protein
LDTIGGISNDFDHSNQLDYLRNIFIFIFFIWQFFISFKTIQVCLIMITMRKDETIKNKVNHFILYLINEYYLLSIIEKR